MKTAEQLAKESSQGQAEAKKEATQKKRLSGTLRNVAKSGDHYGLSTKEVESLHAAAGVLDKLADIIVRAGQIKDAERARLDSRERLFVPLITEAFAGDGSTEHQLLFICAVRSYYLKHEISRAEDIAPCFKKTIDDLAWTLSRKEGEPRVLVAEALKLFEENREVLRKRHSEEFLRYTS